VYGLRQRLGSVCDLSHSSSDVSGTIYDLHFFVFAARLVANLFRQFFEPVDLLQRIAIDRRLVSEARLNIFRELENLACALEVFLVILFCEFDRAFRFDFFFETAELRIVAIGGKRTLRARRQRSLRGIILSRREARAENENGTDKKDESSAVGKHANTLTTHYRATLHAQQFRDHLNHRHADP
jgi:hypothetical protein